MECVIQIYTLKNNIHEILSTYFFKVSGIFKYKKEEIIFREFS
jgi:hypothetical protein